MHAKPCCISAHSLLTYNAGKSLSALTWLSALVLLLTSTAFATVVTGKQKANPAGCTVKGPDYDPGTDVQAYAKYEGGIRNLLKQKRFKDLDCLADAARSSKARFSGGAWKLRMIYGGLEQPAGNATEIDWKNQLQLLQSWVTANPKSITARIALAEAYTNYAWYARGNGFSDTVSQSGWTLFSTRLKKAREILEQASTLSSKCPEWYAAMQNVALGEGWDLAREAALFRQAVAFEPAYDPFYRNQAVFVNPKWNGEEGDPAKLASESADRIGGPDGDILYFQIAKEIVCACEDHEFSHMAWPRLQKGFAALEKKYGRSLFNLNAYALMAVKTDDEELADALFKQIGDKWDKDVWQTEEYFRETKSMAAQAGPVYARQRIVREEATANTQSPEGAAYLKDFQPRFAVFLRKCQEAAASDQSGFVFLLQIARDGSVESAHSSEDTNAGSCLLGELKHSYDLHETAFPPPPSPDYWLKFDMDPAMFKVATR